MKDVHGRTVSLTEMLGKLTKQDLDTFRRVLQVPGTSQLKKHDLAKSLSAYMLDHLEEHLERQDHVRYGFLQKVMQAPGLALPIDENDIDLYEQLSYYERYGLLFGRNEGLAIMPHEIRDGLLRVDSERLRPILDRNTEWVQLTRGLLFYYGNMNVSGLVGKMKQYTGRSVDMDDYLNVISDLEFYDFSVISSSDGFCHYRVDDPSELAQEHRSRPELDFYPFTKAQVLRAAENEYVDRNAGYRRFVSFLRNNWALGKEEAEATAADLVNVVQHGGTPSSLVEYLQEELVFEGEQQLRQLLDVLMEFMNKTRLWALKGYAPEEMFKAERRQPEAPVTLPLQPHPVLGRSASVSPENRSSGEVFDFQTKKKVGRNDPCPCGSGKKFKKCCGS